MVAGHQRHELPLPFGEAGDVAVRDQVVGVLVVLAVAHGASHVVEQGRRLQDGSRRRRQHVEPGQVVEEGERHPRHLVGVHLVEGEAPPQRPGCLAGAGVGRVATLPLQHVHEQALSQPGLDGGDALQPEPVHDRLEDDRSGDDDLAAPGVEDPPPLVEPHPGEHLDGAPDALSGGHPAPALGGEGDDGADGPRASERAARVREPRQGALEGLRGEGAHEVEPLRGHLAHRVEGLGETHRADGDAEEARGVVAHRDRELGGAAADVHHEVAGPGRLAAQDAQRDEARLLLAGDDLELEAGGGVHAGHHVGPVLRLAHRARRHRANERPVPAGQRRVPAQRGHEPLLHLARDPAGLEDPLARADRVALRVDELEGAVGEGPGELQPDGVRADVDGAEDPGVEAAGQRGAARGGHGRPS